MRTRPLLLIPGCLLAFLLLGTNGLSRPRVPPLTYAIVDQGTDNAGRRSALLLLTNNGAYRICYPDGFFVQTNRTATPTYVPTTQLWLDPGGHAVVPFVIPIAATNWCGIISYYAETPWNRLKMRLGSSSIGRSCLSGVTGIAGSQATSPWINTAP